MSLPHIRALYEKPTLALPRPVVECGFDRQTIKRHVVAPFPGIVNQPPEGRLGLDAQFLMALSVAASERFSSSTLSLP